jgi:hypothetical protein
MNNQIPRKPLIFLFITYVLSAQTSIAQHINTIERPHHPILNRILFNSEIFHPPEVKKNQDTI